MQEDQDDSKRILQLIALHRNQFVIDLDVRHLLPILLEKLVLQYEDKQLIDAEPTQQKKAERLLQILEAKSFSDPEALPTFKNSLKKHYDWLYNKLDEDIPDSKLWETQRLLNGHKNKDVLELGWVQRLPVVNIVRKELLDDVVSKLSILKRNHYLVIQGMAGCGKSVLATQAVHELYLKSKNYQGGVYWLSIGKECSDSNDAMLAKMRLLCDKLGVTRAPESLEHGAELLREAFLKLPDALLVLDNVWRHKVIRSFDIGCRVMVTTQDMAVMDVVNGRLAHCICIAEGFKEQESLNFFCRALNIPIDELPVQAKMIHNECKGSPMVVSLIASLHQDHQASGAIDDNRWTHYYESLSKRKFSGIRRDRSYEHPSVVDAMSLSFESLSKKHQSYYQDFGLFQDDVAIPCKVLETLWQVNKWEAEDIMKYFVRKSLAMDEYDPDQKTHIYSVHDLQLDYLKFRLSIIGGDTEKDLHIKFVKRYELKCKGEFNTLADDGYIFFHIGYHLFKSGLVDFFPKIYLDLKFIGEKLKITGPADVLIDFRRYRDFITQHDEEKILLLEELETFTQQVGYRMYGQTDMDIIQMIIQLPKLPLLSHQARLLAKSLKNRLYIEWKNCGSGQWKNPESTVLCGEYVRCVKFVGAEGRHFIVALSNGEIKLCDLYSSSTCHIFTGHVEAVNSLDIFCPSLFNGIHSTRNNNDANETVQQNIFLSGSDDKTCKLWELNTVFQQMESKSVEVNLDNTSTPSPKLRPKSWTFEQPKDESFLSFRFHTAPVIHVEFYATGTHIISTSCHEIFLWNASNGQAVTKISSTSSPFQDAAPFRSCHFPPDRPDYILSVAENQIAILSPTRPSIQSRVHGHNMKIVQLLFTGHDSFCTVSENEVAVWKIIIQAALDKKNKNAFSRTPTMSNGTNRNSIDGLEDYEIDGAFQSCFNRINEEFLHPESSNIRMNSISRSNRSSRSNTEITDIINKFRSLDSGRASPISNSDCFTPDKGVASIEIGKNVFQIVREDLLHKVGHGLFLCAAIDSNDKDLLACGTSDHKVVLYQLLDKLAVISEFSCHNGWVTTLDFSLVDDFTLLSGSADQTVMVWDVAVEEKGELEPQKTGVFASNTIRGIDGSIGFVSIFATDQQSIQVYKGAELCAESESLKSAVTVIGMNYAGTHGAAGTKEGKIWWIKDILKSLATPHWNSAFQNGAGSLNPSFLNTEFLGEHHGASVVCLQFGATADILATASVKDILIWKDFTPHRRMELDSTNVGNLINLHFGFRDSALIVCGSTGYVGIESVCEKRHLSGWSTVGAINVTCSTVNSDSQRLAIGSSEDGIYILRLKENVGVVDTKSLDCKHNSPIRSLAFSDEAKLAVGHENGLITIWGLSFEHFIEERDLILHKSRVQQLLFSQQNFGESPWLVSCGDQLAFWSLDKPVDKIKKTTYMEERRRRKSGESSRSSSRNSRLSLEIPAEQKIGRQGKRELLQTFSFRGKYAKHVVSNQDFTQFITVDNNGILYLLDVM